MKLERGSYDASAYRESNSQIHRCKCQISLGKEFAGRQVLVDSPAKGVWIIRTAAIIQTTRLGCMKKKPSIASKKLSHGQQKTQQSLLTLTIFTPPKTQASTEKHVQLDLNNAEFQRT
jgi:hypothetical protein